MMMHTIKYPLNTRTMVKYATLTRALNRIPSWRSIITWAIRADEIEDDERVGGPRPRGHADMETMRRVRDEVSVDMWRRHVRVQAHASCWEKEGISLLRSTALTVTLNVCTSHHYHLQNE